MKRLLPILALLPAVAFAQTPESKMPPAFTACIAEGHDAADRVLNFRAQLTAVSEENAALKTHVAALEKQIADAKVAPKP